MQRLPKNKLIIVAGLVILLLIIIGIAINHKDRTIITKNQGIVDNEEHKYEATVTITADNIIPGTLLIKPDTELFFENHSVNAEGENSVSHTIIQSKAAANQAPNFNSGQIVAGSGYGYTFRKAGTYQFFDAGNPKLTITVNVAN